MRLLGTIIFMFFITTKCISQTPPPYYYINNSQFGKMVISQSNGVEVSFIYRRQLRQKKPYYVLQMKVENYTDKTMELTSILTQHNEQFKVRAHWFDSTNSRWVNTDIVVPFPDSAYELDPHSVATIYTGVISDEPPIIIGWGGVYTYKQK